MKPQLKLASIQTPDGGKMELLQHDGNYSIQVNGLELMTSRQHASEQELAKLACSHLTSLSAPRVLIGGLGMGYTLRQTLDLLGPGAQVVVSELLPDVVHWNQTYFGELNGHPLKDPRVTLVSGDIFELLAQASDSFDAILLDVDNGPSALTDSSNQQLYTPAGIQACRRALRKPRCLAVWSSTPSKRFERIVVNCGFKLRRYRVRAYDSTQANHHFIWVASDDAAILPSGGGEPHFDEKKRQPKPANPKGTNLP